jgi:hypothetical protein
LLILWLHVPTIIADFRFVSVGSMLQAQALPAFLVLPTPSHFRWQLSIVQDLVSLK